MKLWRDEEWLRTQYVEKKLSLRVVAKLAGCHDRTIRYWMRKFGIPSHKSAEWTHMPHVRKAQQEARQRRWAKAKRPWTDRNWLEQHYIQGEMHISEVAELAGCRAATIVHWMQAFNIPARKGKQRLLRVRKSQSGTMKRLHAEGHSGYGEEWHNRLSESIKARWARGGCRAALAKVQSNEFRAEASRRMKHLHSEGIVFGEEWKEKRRGPKSAVWLGGLSFEPYPPTFNESFKKMIRERDDYTCAICKESGNCVHHINYVKEDTNPDNCVTLCRSCHGTTNWNREYWQPKLEELIQKRCQTQPSA